MTLPQCAYLLVSMYQANISDTASEPSMLQIAKTRLRDLQSRHTSDFSSDNNGYRSVLSGVSVRGLDGYRSGL
jgi:hypothetical protein